MLKVKSPMRGVYPLHDWAVTVTHCGRICLKRRKVNLSQVFAEDTRSWDVLRLDGGRPCGSLSYLIRCCQFVST
jgi:hypothetical protein